MKDVFYKNKYEGTDFLSRLCYRYLIIYLFYISFETIWLNLAPSAALSILRYGFEVFGYFLCALLLMFNRKLKFSGYDISLIVIISILIIGALINRVELKIFILGSRWLIRYIFVFFIISQTNWNDNNIETFIRLIKYIMVVQVILSGFQLVARGLADQILLPRYDDILEDVHMYAAQGESSYSLYGSFGRYSEFGYFISLAIWIIIADKIIGRKNKWWYLPIWVVILILSYSRQQVVGLLISGLIFFVVYKRNKLKTKQIVLLVFISIILCVFSVIFLSGFEAGAGTINEGIASRFLSVFSKKFILADYNGHGRTWFYTTGIYRLISCRPILGFGVGMYGCQTAITYDDSVYRLLDIPKAFSMDVYIASIIGQIGIVGFFSLMGFYIYSLKKSSRLFNRKNISNNHKFIAILCFGYCATGLVLTLFGSSLSDRYMSFYLWSLIGIQRKVTDLEHNKSIVNPVSHYSKFGSLNSNRL